MATVQPRPQRPIDLAKLLGKRGHGAEIERNRKAETAQRSASEIILDPMDVAGEYDAKRALYTTLGGEARAITLDDLRTFQDLIRRLGARYKGGITAQGVIDMSTHADLEKANAEIHLATIVQANAGRLHFVTNSGPGSNVVRHHVHVEFPDFKAYSASPADPKKLAGQMLKGRLRFECDCGRFRFWFRYIATKGNFVAGRAETGFPKIRNPKLVGVACKHGLRVMNSLVKDLNTKSTVAKMIERAQKFINDPLKITAAQAKDAAQRQLEAKGKGRIKTIVETKKQAELRRAAAPPTVASRRRAIEHASKLAAKKEAQKSREAALRQTAEKIQAILGTQSLSKKDAAALLKMLAAGK